MSDEKMMLEWLKGLEACVRYGTKLNESDLPMIERVAAALAHPPQARDVGEVQRLHDALKALLATFTDNNFGWADRQSLARQQAEKALAALPPVNAAGDAVLIETALGGAYEMPDGRKFWIDGPAAREMTRRVLETLTK